MLSGSPVPILLSGVRGEPTGCPDRWGKASPGRRWPRLLFFFCPFSEILMMSGLVVVFFFFFLVCFVFPTTGRWCPDFPFRMAFPALVRTFTPLGMEKTFRGAAFWSFRTWKASHSPNLGRETRVSLCNGVRMESRTTL